MSKRAWIFTVLWTLAALAPQALQACATCYGQSDSDLARGLNWGIFTLLVVVQLVLGTFVVFFVFLARRAAAYPHLPASANALTTKQ